MTDPAIEAIERLLNKRDALQEQVKELQRHVAGLEAQVEYLQGEIDKVPALLVYGNWDYKRCLFCGGKREHKPGCIKE